MTTKQRVRIIDMDDRTMAETTLDSFLKANKESMSAVDVRRLCAGKLVQFGGGAQPHTAVQLIAKPVTVPKRRA